MLKLPNLDDRYFHDIVKQARSMISKRYPEWTDENAHDPGITLIELFAWYAEMQQYYADQITKALERKFLRLLGIDIRPMQSANVNVTFSGVGQDLQIPKGLPMSGGGVTFETEDALRLMPMQIHRVLVQADADIQDATTANKHSGVSFYVFGQNPQKGNQLLIGFQEPLPFNTPIRLFFQVFDQYPIPATPMLHPDHWNSPVSIELSYFSGNPEATKLTQTWEKAQILADETFHFHFSGAIDFQLNQPIVPATVRGANDQKRYWLRFEIKDGRYEVAPRLEAIMLNTTKAVQQKTYSKVLMFNGTGEADQTIRIDEYLAIYGHIEVQIYETLDAQDSGWVTWTAVDGWNNDATKSRSYRLIKDDSQAHVLISFGDGISSSIPAAMQGNIRVILCETEFEAERMILASNGLPHQKVDWIWEDLQEHTFLLQSAKVHESGIQLWQDWRCVEDFHASTEKDHHFMFDRDRDNIQFGDDINGRIPPANDELNVRVIQMICSGGTKGNITKQVIDQVDGGDERLTQLAVTNFEYAKGGANRESLHQAKDRFLREFNQTQHAVTAADMERIVLDTPGLRVARVKAIPLYKPGLRNYPQQKAPAQVTIVVVPYSEEAKPYVSPGFLQMIRSHLDKYRLLTTELHVIPPDYIKITVNATIVVKPQFKNEQHLFIQALNHVLQPFDRSNRAGGWPFGRAVHKGDLLEVLNQQSGMLYVQNLRIEAEGTGYQLEQTGDILIPPQGLVYSGKHQIELISATDL